MASRRKEHQEDAKLRVLQIISNSPQMTSRRSLLRKLEFRMALAYLFANYRFIDKGICYSLQTYKENDQIEQNILIY